MQKMLNIELSRIVQNNKTMKQLAIGTIGLLLSGVSAMAQVPISDAPLTRTLRSVSIEDLVSRKLDTGVYTGSPKVVANQADYEKNFYNTLASYRGEPIPQYVPPPCDQPQPTKYDAEGCREANSLFKDVEDPAKRKEYQDRVRRGRDVWHKGTFGNQDYFQLLIGKTLYGTVRSPDQTNWFDTRNRKDRFAKWGMINDPDCTEGDASTFWLDKCLDPHATGVIGLRKYINNHPPAGFDPKTAPYQEGEIADGRRYLVAQACAVCHTAFDPTNPPKDPENPQWENLTGHVGHQHTNNTMQFFGNLPKDHYARVLYDSIEPGTVDTTSGHQDYTYNPGTQNNITDLHVRPVFEEKIKNPLTGEVKMARTRHVLKGGEDSVGEVLALLRVYLNIGLCAEECSLKNFAEDGTYFGEKSRFKPFRIKQCQQDCEPWNQAEAKMGDLASYLITGGPFYLRDAKDVDGTPGTAYIKDELVPKGHTVFARECARCHSTHGAPDAIKNDKDKMADFYKGHVFGREQDYAKELGEAMVSSAEFQAKYLKDGRPVQFAEKGLFGIDWLGNDQLTPVTEVGTNRCRSMHGNQLTGAVWEEFSSETYKEKPAAMQVARKFNAMLPGIGGKESWLGGSEVNAKSQGYYRNLSILSAWAIAPFLHNNALGKLKRMPNGAIDYTVKGRIEMFEDAMNQLLMSDDTKVTPSREPKITVIPVDMKIPTKPGGDPFIPVPKGTPAANLLNINPHSPLHMTCSDYVENKGHQFGVSLSADDKKALIEFLKTI